MRKATIVGVVAVAAALIAVAVAAATGTFDRSTNAPARDDAGAMTAGRAQIMAAGGNPIRVVGSGFKPAEHVRVQISGNRGSGRRVTASAKGSFTVKLKTGSDCPSLTVDAIGDKGSRASFNVSSFVCR